MTNNLTKVNTQLNVNNAQILQEAITLSSQLVLLNFQSISQLWNITNQTLVATESNNNIFERIALVYGGNKIVVYIRFNIQKDIRELFRFDFELNTEIKIGEFSKQGSIGSILPYKQGGSIRVLINGQSKKSSKLLSLNSEFKEFNYDSFVSASNLSEDGFVIIHQTHINGNKFWFVKGDSQQEHTIQISSKSVISQVIILPNSQILIKVYSQNRSTDIILYNLNERKVIKTWNLTHLIDHIIISPHSTIVASSLNMKENNLTNTILNLNEDNQSFNNSISPDGEVVFSEHLPYLKIKSTPSESKIQLQSIILSN